MFVPPGFTGIRPDGYAGLESEEPGPSGLGAGSTEKPQDVEDTIDLLDELEALEMVNFDPSVSLKDSWEPPRSMVSFLERQFNRSLSDLEREAIMKDFPKPNCEALTVPKLDQEGAVEAEG